MEHVIFPTEESPEQLQKEKDEIKKTLIRKVSLKHQDAS